MKDIDFDELDKAVSSLMAATPGQGDAEGAAPVQISTATTPVVTPPTPTPASPSPAVTPVPSAPAASVAAEAVPAPAVVRSAPPAARRSGRFMDMVHSSSDMKPRTETPAPAAAAPSREGLSITPRSDASIPAEPSANSTTQEPAASEPSSSAASSESMPDPIDIAAASNLDMEPAKTEVTPAVQTDQPDVTTLGSVESPFLTDAKVEKRPLNADQGVIASLEPMTDMLQLDENDDKQESALRDESMDQNGADEPPAVPEVPELSSDLVAIESSDKVDVTQAVDTGDAMSQVDAPAVPLGPASIPQQYTPQPSTGDQSHAAIYDASQYPEPLAHPAKSKSGWLWVLWVILLLGVGAGGALVLYNLGIIP